MAKDSMRNIPEVPGVYEISCQAGLCTVFIGRAIGKGGLRQRVGQRITNPKRFLSGYEKRITKQGCRLLFHYAQADTREQAKYWESALINEYKKLHGHLPPGNKQTPHMSSC